MTRKPTASACLLLILLASLGDARSVDASPFYKLTPVAVTGQVGLTGMGDQVSINDKGVVAFVGQLSGGESVFVGDGTADPKNITPGFVSPNRKFGRAVQINNEGEVVAHDQVAGAPPSSFIRLWDSSTTDSFMDIARGTSFDPNFAAVLAQPTVNNDGQVVFSALPQDSTATGDELATPDGSGNFLTYPFLNVVPLRPMIADNGSAVFQAGALPTSSIVLLSSSFRGSGKQIIADTTYFRALGSSPGISDDGQVVVFYGDISPLGADTFGTTTGPGIFASVATLSGRKIVRIAGVAPGGVLDPTRPALGPFSAFDSSMRAGVNSQGDQRGVTVVYAAFDATSSKEGIYTSRLSFFGNGTAPYDPTDPKTFTVNPSALVVRQGDTVPGVSGIVQSVSLYDPVNNRDRGDVAFWASFSGGAQAVIRARSQQVVFLDFDPVDNFSAALDPGSLLLFRALGAVPKFFGNISDVFTFLAPGRADLNGTSAVTAIQDSIVDGVQFAFLNLDPGITPTEGVNVVVMGYVGEPPPTDGPYTRVFIGDSPFTDMYPSGVAGIAPLDVFNQSAVNPGGTLYQQKTPLIFVDNRFRASIPAFTTLAGSPPVYVPVKLSDTGAGKITVTDVETALTDTISHEIGHSFGLRHLTNDYSTSGGLVFLNAITMHQNILSPLLLPRGDDVDDARIPQYFGVVPNQLTLGEGFLLGDLENSGARLAFAAGSDLDDTTLPRDAPSSAVLTSENRVNLSTALTLSTSPITVARAAIGIVPDGYDDAMPEWTDLGGGDLATLLNTTVLAGPHDQIILLASTNGLGIDIFGVGMGDTGAAASINLSSGLFAYVDGRIRGDLYDAMGLPATASLAVFRRVAMGTVQIGTLGPGGVAPPPSADLSLSAAAPSTGTAGSSLTYTLTVKNAGPSPAAGVALTDTLPAGVASVSSTPSATTSAGGVLTFSLGTFAAGATATVTITVTPTAPGTFKDTAQVVSTTADPSMANNSAAASTNVQPSPATNVTGQVQVTRGGFRFSHAGRKFVQVVTIKDTGGAALTGPLSLALDGLSGNATLSNKMGATVTAAPPGSPYLNVSTAGLGVGQSAVVTLEFSDPTKTGITYNVRVLAGPGAR